MTRLNARLASGLGGALIVGLLAFPAATFANTSEPIAQTGGMSATLPLFGTTLTVDVTLDTSTGNISNVALTPSTGYTATTTQPSIVKYSNTAGTTTVTVRALGNAESIKARSGSLNDFVGSGTWSADVFGTGAKSTVAYTIGKDGSGNPTLAFGTITPASGITDTVVAPTSSTDDEWAVAAGGVNFAWQGFTKRLWISIGVDKEDGHASLKITLFGRDRQLLTGSLTDLAGPRTWSAHLCDGTAVSVAYHVNPDGTISYDGATGGTATEKTFSGSSKGKGWGWGNVSAIWVKFNGTNVGVTIALHKNSDGTYSLLVRGSSGRCGTKDGKHHGNGWSGIARNAGGWGDGSGGSGDWGFGGDGSGSR